MANKFLDLNGVQVIFDVVDEKIAKAQLEGEVDLTPYALKSEIPAPYDDTAIKQRISTLEAIDHSNYLTEHQDISTKADKSELPTALTADEIRALINE